MKKTLSMLFVGAVIVVLTGCGGLNATAKKDFVWWSNFTGESVTSVRTVYPTGDVPHTSLKMQSGAGRIY